MIINSKNTKKQLLGYDLLFDFDNNRLKILSFKNITHANIYNFIDIAKENKLSKVICFVDKENYTTFLEAGFVQEGYINSYYNGNTAFCMSYFTDLNRFNITNQKEENQILQKIMLSCKKPSSKKNLDFKIKTATIDDIEKMIILFKNTFSTYPSPVLSEGFLKKCINSNVLYKVAYLENELIGIASADIDYANSNAEITDCATNIDYRGNGILSSLINELEKELKEKGIITAFSLCRAIHPSINYVLYKHNYTYCGRLNSNCNICSNYEDMNIWTKNLI